MSKTQLPSASYPSFAQIIVYIVSDNTRLDRLIYYVESAKENAVENILPINIAFEPEGGRVFGV